MEVDGTFPEGQAVVVGMLNEAHEIVRQLLMKCDYYKVTSLCGYFLWRAANKSE